VKIGVFELDPTFNGDIQMVLSRLKTPFETVADGNDANEFDDTPPKGAEDYDSLDDSSDWDRDQCEAYNGYEDDDSGSDKDSGSGKSDQSDDSSVSGNRRGERFRQRKRYRHPTAKLTSTST
jgi:hypothetical protein